MEESSEDKEPIQEYSEQEEPVRLEVAALVTKKELGTSSSQRGGV